MQNCYARRLGKMLENYLENNGENRASLPL
jgi:hypothetical protein